MPLSDKVNYFFVRENRNSSINYSEKDIPVILVYNFKLSYCTL